MKKTIINQQGNFQCYRQDIINELSAIFKQDLKREIAKEVGIINSALRMKNRDDLTHIDEEIKEILIWNMIQN